MKKLKKGWVEGDIQDFLELSAADAEYIETKLTLCRRMRDARQEQRLTQAELAKQLHTSQARIARMENGDPEVSLDAVMKALFGMGQTRRDIFKRSLA